MWGAQNGLPNLATLFQNVSFLDLPFFNTASSIKVLLGIEWYVYTQSDVSIYSVVSTE